MNKMVITRRTKCVLFLVAALGFFAVLPCSAQEKFPERPLEFYRVGMLEWSDMKDITGDGRRYFNLFLSQADAFGFLENELSGKNRPADARIYRFTEHDLARTADGREFLAEVRAELARYPERVDMTVMFSDEQSFRESIRSLAEQRVFYTPPPKDPAAAARNFVPNIVAPETTPPKPEPPPHEAAPGPVDPNLETRIENFLRSVDLGTLNKNLADGNFDVFQNPLFKPEGDTPEAREKIARAWKKVCVKPEFTSRSAALASLRQKMLVDVFAEVALANEVRIELIDSGKRNAYGSDIDVTVYASEKVDGVPVEALIQEAEARINQITRGNNAQSFDITIHNGEVFMPDVRNHGQSVAEYSKSLRAAVAQLRLKVLSGGDASYFPGANIEDVQKRGMRDGLVTELKPEIEILKQSPDGTPLETRIKKPVAKQVRASEYLPSGDLVSNSLRFNGLQPAYDRSNAFGALSQNLEKIYRNGDKPGDVAKLFNRGMELGAGAGEVNSYLSLHVSDLPAGSMTPEEAARIAFEIEQANVDLGKIPFTEDGKQRRLAKLNEINQLKQRAGNKDVAKMRWIIRSFGYRGGNVAPQNIIWLYDLLNLSSDIEVDKSKGNFDFKKSRLRYLQRPFSKLAAANPQLAKTPEGAEQLFDMAWRDISEQMVDATEMAMIKTMKEALAALKPEKIREYARKGQIVQAQNGRPVGSPENAQAQEQAKKLAEKLRVELVLLFDFINSRSHPYVLDLSAADAKRVSERAAEERVRLEALREAIMENVPDNLKPEVEKLDRIARTQMDNFLTEFDETGKPRPQTAEELVTAKEEAVKRITEVSADEAERSVLKEALKEHIVNLGLLIYNPADGPVAQQVLNLLTEGLGGSITGNKRDEKTGREVRDPNTGEKLPDTAGKALAEQLKANLTSPLMLGSSAVGITRAYVTGGRQAAIEAAVGEGFNLMPPAYGLIGIAFKDFARGNVEGGLKSVRTMGMLHVAEKMLPGIGQAVLFYNVATGVPELVYTYTAQKINEDFIEQAVRSYPVPGKRAARNPYKDSTDFFKGDTPNFPIFFDNACMKEPDDHLSIKERFPIVANLYSSEIARELKYWGLSQDEIKEIEKKSEKYENPNLKPNTPKWNEARLHLLEKYVFDHPYYQRIKKIYECYFPIVKEERDNGFDEDNVLKHVFGKAVDEWYRKQDVGYQMEFAGTVERLRGREEEARKQLLSRITNYVIGQYKWYEEEPIRKQIQMEKAAAAFAEMAQRPQRAEKQIVATKKLAGDRLEQNLSSYILSSMGQGQSTPSPIVRVKAPSWYVSMKGLVLSGPADAKEVSVKVDENRVASMTVTNNQVTGDVLSDVPGKPADDAGEIPVDVEVRTDRDTAKGLTHDLKITLAAPADKAITRGMPAGFVPNAEEQKLLAELGNDNKPKNDIFTINLSATATVYDAQGRMVGQPKSAPIVGYVIAEVPRFKQTIAIRVSNERSPQVRGVVNTPFEARIGTQSRRGQTAAIDSTVKFEDLSAGNYRVTVTPDSEEYGPGTATFTLKDTFSKQAIQGQTKEKNPEVIDIVLPYKGKPVTAAKTPKSTDEDSTKPAIAKLPPKTSKDPGQDPPVTKAKDDDPATQTNRAVQQQAIDEIVKKKVADSQTKSSQCEYEGALQIAMELMQTNPGHPALAGLNIGQLQTLAKAQGSARVLLQLGRASILQRNLDGAIAALQGALAVPNLPDCMKRGINDLLGDISARKRFGELAPLVDPAIEGCNFKEAARLVGLISNINPRSPEISAWLSEYSPRVSELQKKEREALTLIQQAGIALQNARTAADRQRIRVLVIAAKKKIAPCEVTMDPALSNLTNTDDTPEVEEPKDDDGGDPARGTRKGEGNSTPPTPSVEEPPEGEDNTSGGRSGNRGRRGAAPTPSVEEPPDETDDNRGKRKASSPAVEDPPDESGSKPRRTGANGGRRTPSGGDEKTGNRNNNTGGSSSGGSDGDFGNLAGTWRMSYQDRDDYSRVTMPLHAAGKNTWQGVATNDSNVPPCSADSYFTPGFNGNVTITTTGPGTFTMIVRSINVCSESGKEPSEVHWKGTFSGSEMVIYFKENSNAGWKMTRD